jgi:transketolase
MSKPNTSDTIFSDSTRGAYCEALIELVESGKDVVTIEGDVMKAAGTGPFRDRYPERSIQLGIAEQNVTGVAAGLSSVGKIPFVNLFAVHASRRACDQVAVSVAFTKSNVKIVGLYAGLTTAENGPTHQSLEDLAVMRAIPNMTVVVPADTRELKKAVKAIAEHTGPAYLRLVRGDMPILYDGEYEFRLGKSVVFREGKDLSIIGAGILLSRALKAYDVLLKDGISARVINMHTIKPVDREAIIECAKDTGAILTVENHSIIGGLGSAVAEVTAEHYPVRVSRIGVRDIFGETGSFDWLLKHFGMDVDVIVHAAKELVKSKASAGRLRRKTTVSR